MVIKLEARYEKKDDKIFETKGIRKRRVDKIGCRTSKVEGEDSN